MDMFFRMVLLGISFVVIFFIFEILVPKVKRKYKRYKELRKQEISQKEFKKKMEELEIK